MSAEKSEIIRISVTDGDAIETNRTAGKSNTGTYFVCSEKDWVKFEKFFPGNNSLEYRLDLRRIALYKSSFVSNFLSFKNNYSDKMRHFEDICDSLMAYFDNPIVKINTRKNDVRFFMKFDDNNREVERAVRGILYSKLSNLVFEMSDGVCWIYPEINLDILKPSLGEKENENDDK